MLHQSWAGLVLLLELSRYRTPAPILRAIKVLRPLKRVPLQIPLQQFASLQNPISQLVILVANPHYPVNFCVLAHLLKFCPENRPPWLVMKVDLMKINFALWAKHRFAPGKVIRRGQLQLLIRSKLTQYLLFHFLRKLNPSFHLCTYRKCGGPHQTDFLLYRIQNDQYVLKPPLQTSDRLSLNQLEYPAIALLHKYLA